MDWKIGIVLFINYVSMYHRISPILTPAAVGDEGGVGQPRQVEARRGRQESPCAGAPTALGVAACRQPLAPGRPLMNAFTIAARCAGCGAAVAAHCLLPAGISGPLPADC